MPRIIIDPAEVVDRLKLIKNYPLCKINDYANYIKYIKWDHYVDVKSRKQIRTIVDRFKHNKTGLFNYHSFLSLLLKHIDFNNYNRYANMIMNSAYDDLQFYKMIRKYVKRHHGLAPSRQHSYDTCSRDKVHAQNVYHAITRNIPSTNTISNYFDFGCGDCVIPQLLGNMFGLDKENTYGGDIHSWGDYNEEKRQKIPITIVRLEKDKPIPFEDNHFSLVSAMMVLHHVENLMYVLKELNRITKMGGYIYVREHDADTNATKILCDIEHAMYEVVKRGNDNFFDEYYGVYYSWVEWLILFRRAGFDYVHGDFYYSTNIRNIGATRAYYCIYKKVEHVDTSS